MRQDAWYFPHLCQFLGSKIALWIGAQGPHALPTRTRLSAATDPARFLQEGQCILSRTRKFSREIMERPQEYLGSHKNNRNTEIEIRLFMTSSHLSKVQCTWIHARYLYVLGHSLFSNLPPLRLPSKCDFNHCAGTKLNALQRIRVNLCDIMQLLSTQLDTQLRPVLDCRRSKWGRR